MSNAINAAKDAGLNFSLKSIKHLKSSHDDCLAYSAKLYLNGKLFCDLENDGWGGPVAMSVAVTTTPQELDDVLVKVNSINVQCTNINDQESYVSRDISICIDLIVAELLEENFYEKQYQKCLKKLGFIHSEKINYFPKLKPTHENIAWMTSRPDWLPGFVVIQGASRADVLAALGLNH